MDIICKRFLNQIGTATEQKIVPHCGINFGLGLMMLFILLISLVPLKRVQGQNFSEILGRPTDKSITISLLFEQSVEFYFEYGTIAGSCDFSTSVYTNTSHVPDEVDLVNLLPDTRYYYRTRYRLTGSGVFLTGQEHSFHTQRALGSSFNFTVEADVHLYDKKGVGNVYRICLANQAADKPDFMIDLWDTFGDDRNVATMTSDISDSLHRMYRPFFGEICHSAPFFFCLGNHEGEFDYYLSQSPPDNLAVWGTLWRKFYYPNPFPNEFYSGNTNVEDYGIGNPENYYAFSWGDALFVVLDVCRDQCDTSAKPIKWNWSLGYPQYEWLKSTLEGSSAPFKFVFAHHVSGQGRGGAAQAGLFEWGGHEQNGNYTFPTMRPGWAKSIHELFVDNGVTIFFQGHDHLFAHEVKDGVVYQEVPMPSDSTYEIGLLANADAYQSDVLGGSGHLNVSVSPACVKVDFVKAYLPADTLSGLHHNREIGFSYSIGNCLSGTDQEMVPENHVSVFPNPASSTLHLLPDNPRAVCRTSVYNSIGTRFFSSQQTDLDVRAWPNGMYLLQIESRDFSTLAKVLILH